jgi:hypothetical protein
MPMSVWAPWMVFAQGNQRDPGIEEENLCFRVIYLALQNFWCFDDALASVANECPSANNRGSNVPTSASLRDSR